MMASTASHVKTLAFDEVKRQTENLNRVLVGKKVDDFEGVGNDADSHLFLTCVATMLDEAA